MKLHLDSRLRGNDNKDKCINYTNFLFQVCFRVNGYYKVSDSCGQRPELTKKCILIMHKTMLTLL